MRIVILSSSVYSETACAMAAHVAAMGHVPVGSLALSTLKRGTLLRKIGQWGMGNAATYARAKMFAQGQAVSSVSNPYLLPMLRHGSGQFGSLRQVAAFYNFPLVVGRDQNSRRSVERVRRWSPDLILFAGGDILRTELLQVPRLGVLNVHLGWLPDVRGMSSPEWSLLLGLPLGVTIHFMDSGIDTGPILKKNELPEAHRCKSLADLRNRLIAFGIENLVDVVSRLDRSAISASPQWRGDSDNQFFVIHDFLRGRAEQCLTSSSPDGNAT
jgi:methionyl-tRNA formyltransferase